MREEEERELNVNEAVLFFKESVTKSAKVLNFHRNSKKREGKLEAFFKEEVKHTSLIILLKLLIIGQI